MTVQIEREANVATDPPGGSDGVGGGDAVERWSPPVPDPNRLDYDGAVDLGAQIVAGAAKVASITAAWVEMVGVFDAGSGSDQMWMGSTAHWLAFACSMSAGTAREHVRVARALRRMPIVAASFNRGELSFSKIRECTRLVGMIDEDTLVKCARDWTAAQLERAVRGFRAGRTTRLIAQQQRRVCTRTHSDGTVQITAYLPAEEAAVVLAALDVAVTRYRTEQRTARADATHDHSLDDIEAAADSHSEAGAGGGDTDSRSAVGGEADAGTGRGAAIGDRGVPAGTPAAENDSLGEQDEDEDDVPAYTRADALIDVARGYLAAGAADTSGEDRDIVVVHVSAGDLDRATTPPPPGSLEQPDPAADVPAGTPTTSNDTAPAGAMPDGATAGDGGPASAWIESVGTVSASTAARIACTGMMQMLLTDTSSGEVLHLGRTHRLATRQQRRAMMARDKHCQFPGCARAVRLHAHHLTPWSVGGLTDTDKMIMLCQHHHVLVHAASITITTHPDRPGYRFTRVGGHVITAQHPSQYSNPENADYSIDSFKEAQLLDDLITDARSREPVYDPIDPRERAPRSSTAHLPDWDLPAAMESVRELTSFYHFDTNLFPRWEGARMTEGDYYAILEPKAHQPRTNPNARY